MKQADDRTQEVLDAALAAGATDAEAYAEESEETTVRVFQGSVDTRRVARTAGLGVRVYVGRKLAFVSSCRPDDVLGAVRQAVAAAGAMDEDPWAGLPDPPAGPYPEVASHDGTVPATSVEDKEAFLLGVEEAVRARDGAVHTENFTYRDAVTRTRIASTRGVQASGVSSHCSVFGVASLKEADRGGRGHFLQTGPGPGALDADRAVEDLWTVLRTSLEGRPFAPRQMSVVFAPSCAAGLVRALGAAFSARLAGRGQSFLSGRLGEKALSGRLTLSDDRTLPHRPATAAFDAEGAPARRTVLVEAGVVRRLLTDAYWARRLGAEHTASAARQGYGSRPAALPSHLVLEPGEASEEDLLAEAGEGFYLLDMLSVGGVNPVTGQFSVAGCGFRIEGGRCTAPVAGVTVAGSLLSMLEGVRGLGSNQQWHAGAAAPSLLFEGLTVGGRG